MDVLLYILGSLLLISGLLGAFIPVLPGPPLSFAGLFALHFTALFSFDEGYLIVLGLLSAVVTFLDYFIPIWGTKFFGGTKAGARGAIAGLIIGLLFAGPFGIVFGPFFGALIAELIQNSDDVRTALRSAVGSLVGFLMGTALKMAYGIGVIIFVISGFSG